MLAALSITDVILSGAFAERAVEGPAFNLLRERF